MRRLWFHLLIIISLIALIVVLGAPVMDARSARAPAPPVSRLRVAINIPAFRLDAFVDDSLVHSTPIAVGMPAFKSPRGDFAITSVEWNPWWIPPDSKWAKKEKVTPPGPANPMGRVKINFHELYFLHGTPLDASIGSAASHGCIRMHNADAIALARLVMEYGALRLSADDRARLAADSSTKRIELDAVVPISLRYDRVEMRGDTVVVYRDVYGIATRSIAAQLDSAFAARGIDTASVDRNRIRSFTRSIARRGNSALVASLMRGSEAP